MLAESSKVTNIFVSHPLTVELRLEAGRFVPVPRPEINAGVRDASFDDLLGALNDDADTEKFDSGSGDLLGAQDPGGGIVTGFDEEEPGDFDI